MSPAAFIDDPNWADFLPEAKEPSKKRHLPAHEDCSRIDAGSAAAHLMAGGTLGMMEGYEERPGQIDMLKAVVRAFNSREHLMIEAGTGVGKSLAYLVPSVLWAWTNDTPVIVSTATRNLQSQLIGADIPRAVGVLGAAAAAFKVALLKGRGNYLCLRAVSEFFAPGYWTMSAEEQAEMPRFIEWLRTTPDGDLDRYDGLPRHLITCPGEECGGRRCPYYSRCFIYRARRNAADAHLVVANHSLVLAEAGNDAGSILPASGRLVLDEAHNLESIATEQFSSELSMPALTRLLNRLLRKGRGRRQHPGGILSAVERQLQRGVLSGSAAAEAVRRAMAGTPGLIVRVVDAAESFFDVAERLLAPARDQVAPVRYRFSEGARRHSSGGLFKAYEPDVWDEAAFAAAQSRMEEEIAALVTSLHGLRESLNASAPDGEFNYCADLSTQLDGVAAELVGFANEGNFVIRGEKDTHAYWAERVRHADRRPFVRLVAAPLSVADALETLVYSRKDSVILSSATLRVGGDFRYMAGRLGCRTAGSSAEGRFRALVAPSPFDYLRQALVLAPDCLPDPSADPRGYASALAGLLKGLFEASRGRALVLFTSYEMMNAVAASARPSLEAVGVTLIVQGEGRSRESMTAALKGPRDGERVVLFGAQSFWEGVDVSGEALSCVVIARLPFAQIGDPVTEARGEKIEREGGSRFRDYALPEAVIKFRQGFGRLVRSKRDRGVVIVADPRIVTKGYGAVFRKSIPASVHTVADASLLLERVESFFAG